MVIWCNQASDWTFTVQLHRARLSAPQIELARLEGARESAAQRLQPWPCCYSAHAPHEVVFLTGGLTAVEHAGDFTYVLK
jgi:hypothetical protein